MYRHVRTVISTTVFFQLLACGTGVSSETAALYERLNGIFVSDGYGYVVDLRGDTRDVYHLSGGTCVFDADTSAGIQHVLGPDDVVEATDGQSFAYGDAYETHKIVFLRIPALPASCATPLPDTPHGNFEAFAAAFSAHYAFFELYGVNWPQQVAAARSEVTSSMTDEDLFALFSDMVAPIMDSHLSLEAEINGSAFSIDPVTTELGRGAIRLADESNTPKQEIVLAALDRYWNEGVAEDILAGQGRETAGGKLQYGLIDSKIGYINVLMLMGYTSDAFFPDTNTMNDAEEHQRVNAILDEIMISFAEAEVNAVIIDASLNFGGSDYMGREIAARFADRQRLAYTKAAFDAAGAPETSVYIVPTDRPSFDGPVYLMTTDSTVSAGETMTMALRALPNVTHVGQPTNGSFSDVLNKTLPNGWSLTLSNEIYRDHAGILWEGRGITPDIPLDIFNETTLVNSHPAAVATLVAHIQSQLNK
ncbi:S41 family peptidase [Yoonia sp. I 8.24]|uniref:S41 family peptidase n=1 Tax=Yoonia sp. I 8.24 TaxID=1537229 RepID=UPI001EDDA37A|nr:S41 family peptidase [Yoonia sp. I 8.24]MCG3267878.1 S41 family peptidase [Yoonia sp. I 8.24]